MSVLKDARPVISALPEALPAPLRDRTPESLERFWPEWVAHRDAEVRARLEDGEEDSLVNLLMFGTSFTREPRITIAFAEALSRQVDSRSAMGSRVAAIVNRRIRKLEKEVLKVKDRELEYELALLRKIDAWMEEEKPMRGMELTGEDLKGLAIGLRKVLDGYEQTGIYSFNMNFFTGSKTDEHTRFHILFSPRTFFNQALGTPDVGALRNLFNETMCMAFPEEINDMLKPEFAA